MASPSGTTPTRSGLAACLRAPKDAGMGTEPLGWDCWGGDAGIKHANVVQLGMLPEDAMTHLLDRAVQKYGPQDWSTWDFRAEPVPKNQGATVLRFVWRDGQLERIRADG